MRLGQAIIEHYLKSNLINSLMPEPSEGKIVVDDLIQIEPNRENALFALTMSADLLISAKQKFENKEYLNTIDDAKNCIRVAVSALLYNDGYVAASIDSSVYYLEKNYSGLFPLNDWKIIEAIKPDEIGGLFEILIKKLGREKEDKAKTFGDDQSNAKVAISSAEKFVTSVRYLLEAEIEREIEREEEQMEQHGKNN